MTPAAQVPRPADAFGVLGWRLYLLSVAISFLVIVEPAATDLVFLVGFGFLLLSKPQRTPFLSGTAVVGIVLFCVATVFAMTHVVYRPAFAFRALVIEFYMFGLFALTAYYTKIRGDRAFFYILLALSIGTVCASLVAVGAILDLFPNSRFFFREGVGVRVRATFKDPNVFGPFLVPGILFMCWVILESARFRMIAIGVLGLFLVSLVSTYSRGAWGHTAISLSVFGLAMLIYRPTARPAFVTLLVLVLSMLVTFVLFQDQIMARLENSFFLERLALQSYDESRFGYVADAEAQIWAHPTGIGPRQAPFKFGYLPHNTFIAIALHNGVLAAIGLALVFLSSVVRCIGMILGFRPGWTKYAYVLAILLGLLVLSQVVGAHHWRHLFLVCGLAFGSYRSDRLIPEDFLARTKPVSPE